MELVNDLREKYKEKAIIYDTIADYMKIELEELLQKSNISYLTTTSRIKSFESFEEKIDRKKYSNPFEQVEDFCGIRIICYYRSDVLKICKIIEEEFDVLEARNKEDLLAVNEFGYRSFHMIAKIPISRSPTLLDDSYSNFKFEIQIRTILMHAWAEIEHKLAYKSEDQIALSMRKEFAFLSAKLEESDFQFERLRDDSDRIRKEIRMKVEEQQISGKDDLNLDSLRALLESKFPERKEDMNGIAQLLDQLNEANIGLEEVLSAYERTKNYISTNLEKGTYSLTRSGIIRAALNLVNDDFWYNYRKTVDLGKYADWVYEMESQRKDVKGMINK